MRILIVSDNFYPMINGLVVFTQRLALELAQRGHSVLIIAPSNQFRKKYYVHNGIKIFGLPSFPALAYKKMYFAYPFFMGKIVREVLAEFKPDVIHFQSYFTVAKPVLAEAKKLKIPTVGTVHFMPENLMHHLHLPRFTLQKVKAIVWKQLFNFYKKIDLVTAPTATAANFIKDAGFPKRIISISNGIDLKRFSPKNKGSYLKARYKIPRKPVLLYVGRLDREKNLDIVIKAFQLSLSKVDAHLIIGGGVGEEREKLKKLTSELGMQKDVTFTGFVPEEDLQNLYAIANCFVIAGIAELQSIATMEAMASGLPILAADAVALHELVRNDKNGYLFKPSDIKKLSECIIKVISGKKLQKRLSKNSLMIIKKHDINKTVGKFESIYKKLQKNDAKR